MKNMEQRSIGRFTLTIIDGGSLYLDGGAMFGVVPRVLWNRAESADDRNRIKLNCNCLLISDGENQILVETGIGENWSEKYRGIYRISEPSLEEELQAAGPGVEGITHVINTHLHFDHAGGNMVSRGSGNVPRFINADYVVQEEQWKHAVSPSLKDRQSYREEDFLPLKKQGRLLLKKGQSEIIPGVNLLPVGGHTPGMQLVEIADRGERALFMADLIPMRHHVALPWLMAYDCSPLETLSVKEKLLPGIADNKDLLVLYHDNLYPFGRIVEEKEGSFSFAED